MTRQEFIDDVTTWSELLDFCGEEDLDYCEDIISSETRDNRIDEYVSDHIHEYGWGDIMSYLESRDEEGSYDYYIEYDYDLEFTGVFDGDREFVSRKADVISYMDDECLWDADEDEEEEAPYDDEEEAPPEEPDDEEDEDDYVIEAEECSLSAVFAASTACIRAINEQAVKEAKENDEMFIQMMTVTA